MQTRRASLDDRSWSPPRPLVATRAWASCAGPGAQPESVVVVAVDESPQGDLGMAVGWRDTDGRVCVHAENATSLPGAISQARTLAPVVVGELLAGLSIVEQVADVAPWSPRPYGARQTTAATRRFRTLVFTGAIRYMPGGALDLSVRDAMMPADRVTIAQTLSGGPVLLAKLAVWVADRAEIAMALPPPQIW